MYEKRGYRFGEIAVITGNLEEYGNLARQAFDNSGIPCFIDEKHSILMNPFVEYVRAALEMAAQGFSYESVFRYLRMRNVGYHTTGNRLAGKLCGSPESGDSKNGRKSGCGFIGE